MKLLYFTISLLFVFVCCAQQWQPNNSYSISGNEGLRVEAGVYTWLSSYDTPIYHYFYSGDGVCCIAVPNGAISSILPVKYVSSTDWNVHESNSWADFASLVGFSGNVPIIPGPISTGDSVDYNVLVAGGIAAGLLAGGSRAFVVYIFRAMILGVRAGSSSRDGIDLGLPVE